MLTTIKRVKYLHIKLLPCRKITQPLHIGPNIHTLHIAYRGEPRETKAYENSDQYFEFSHQHQGSIDFFDTANTDCPIDRLFTIHVPSLDFGIYVCCMCVAVLFVKNKLHNEEADSWGRTSKNVLS